MAATLRIADASLFRSEDVDGPDPAKDYLARVVKLIPAEVIGLYLAGKTAIQLEYAPPTGSARPGELAYWAVWTGFCLLAVVLVRAWATRDQKRHLTTEWPAVALAAASFLVWVYSFGDLFQAAGVWQPLPATLLVLAWTFVVPFFYRERIAAPLEPETPEAPVTGKSITKSLGPRIETAPRLDRSAVEAIVLGAATRGGDRPRLWTKIADRFDNEHALRQLLADIEPGLVALGVARPNLGRIAPNDVKTLLGQTYDHLAFWVFKSVSGSPK